jgi:integrase
VLSSESERCEWTPRKVSPEVARFSKVTVDRLGPLAKGREKNLLWACAQLGGFAETIGLSLTDDVFKDSVIERFCLCGTRDWSVSTVRTLRTNLRFVQKRIRPAAPGPMPLARSRSKTPYSDAELARYLANCDNQPTEARRMRANGLISLGAGAGLTGVDLRAVRGSDITERSGGVLVQVGGAHPRCVPVLNEFCNRALQSAAWSGEGFVVGGVEINRRNVTSRLIASLSGGVDLPRLEIARLRATWLKKVAELIGLPTFMAAAGISCSQRLGDVVGTLRPGSEKDAVALLGGRI